MILLLHKSETLSQFLPNEKVPLISCKIFYDSVEFHSWNVVFTPLWNWILIGLCSSRAILFQLNLDKGETFFHDRNLWEGVMIVLWSFSADSGATVITAIKVLLDHGVTQENILLLNVFATPNGEYVWWMIGFNEFRFQSKVLLFYQP